MLPEGLKILKYAEVEDGLNLAKLIDAAVYRISGEGAPLDGRAAQVLSDEAARLNALFAGKIDTCRHRHSYGGSAGAGLPVGREYRLVE